MLSRRIASPTLPSTKKPSSSGPRCASCAFSAANVSLSTHCAAPGYTIPQIPHISEVRFAGAETVRHCWLEFVPNALQQVFHHDDTLVRTEYLIILGGLD